jgi:hypothetical protein
MSYSVTFVPKKHGYIVDKKSIDDLCRMAASTQSFIKSGYRGKIKDSAGSYTGYKNILSTIRIAADSITGHKKMRTICAPSEKIKAEQNKVLWSIQNIPLHPAAHGFVRGRDPLSCATAHTDQWGDRANNLVILNMDAENFFHSMTSDIVRKALEAHKLPSERIDDILSTCMIKADKDLAISVLCGLSRIMSNFNRGMILPVEREAISSFSSIIETLLGLGPFCVPEDFVGDVSFVICQSFLSLGYGVGPEDGFLPQGAPTSPCLSNLAMKIVDIRLSAMAKAFGGFYTRYADDLTVSWPAPTKGKVIDGMYRCTELVLKEYFVLLNKKKKRVMGNGVRQDIVGYCVNSGKPTISKQIRKNIRAAVHSELVGGSKSFRAGRKKGKYERHDQLNPSPQRISFLNGHIGRLCAPHPGEALRYRGELSQAINRVAHDGPSIVYTLDEI